jgi:hypothetical protein
MPESTIVNIGDFAALIKPLVSVAFEAIATLVVPVVGAKIYQWFGFKFTEAQWQVIRTAGYEAAARIRARGEPGIVNATFDTHDPTIAIAANHAAAGIPKIAKALGVTQDYLEAELRRIILAKLGDMQSAVRITEEHTRAPQVPAEPAPIVASS